MSELVVNSGDLLDMDGLAGLADEAGLSDEEIRERFTQFRECVERRKGLMSDEATALEVSFYLLGRMFHILGYTHSHTEPLPNYNDRNIDYTLFANADDFARSLEYRGTASFYREALAMAKASHWDSELAADQQSGVHAAEELDDVLRLTAQMWGILTNGALWRLYHRNTVGMVNTYFQVDLREAIETNDFETFKIFASVFSKESLLIDGSGTSPVRRLLT